MKGKLFLNLITFAGDEDVVDVGTAEVETAQNAIDEALEGFGGIP